MKRQRLEVPIGIRYLSDWKEFSLERFPKKCIINKQIPGCGFTEFCINSSSHTIIASPRLVLMWNKFEQHKGDLFITINSMEKDPESDKDISSNLKVNVDNLDNDDSSTDPSILSQNMYYYEEIYRELEEYTNNRFNERKPCKILVTYDSYHVVVGVLTKLGIFNMFETVIDEFQSILHDSRFKSETEIGFLRELEQSPTAYFVSATPMLEEYLDMLDEFKDLPYFELDWESQQPGRVIRPSLDVYLMRTVNTKAEEVIREYLDGNYKKATVVRDGILKEVISDEAIIYVNSVNHIISIIKRVGLTPEQVNIICSNTEYNQKRIRKKLGKKFVIGKVPLKGEKAKMFTFCTRTVYLGADFYSTCARSFIFSDSNSDCLAVDISEDLPQILGRQRLDENPWKNHATFYYRSTADYRKMTKNDFDNIIESKKEVTRNLLMSFNLTPTLNAKNDLSRKYKIATMSSNYRDDYVAVNRSKDPITMKYNYTPLLNRLVLVNEIRAFRIQQIDYKDRFTVFSTINRVMGVDSINKLEVSEFLMKYVSLNSFYDKMSLLCNSNLSKESMDMVLAQLSDSDEIKIEYLTFGPEKIKAMGCSNMSKIRKTLSIKSFDKEFLSSEIYKEFKEGDRILYPNLKDKLRELYTRIGYKATPKATDILDYFETKGFTETVTSSDGVKKRVVGYELLKKKER